MGDTGKTSVVSESWLCGVGVLASVCARALVNKPDQSVIDAVFGVAQALGDDRFTDFSPNATLTQRFYDRFFVTNSPFYIPLYESSIRGALPSDGRVRYASVQGPATEHVQNCDRAIGFNISTIEGFDLSIKSLKPDSMAAELWCMASLVEVATSTREEKPVRDRAEVLLYQFAESHPAHWFKQVSDYMSATDDDFYARVCALAADGVEVLLKSK